MSNLEVFALSELKRAGLFDKDSDYGGMLGKAVMRLIKEFSKEGHSGFSAAMASNLFNKLSRFEPITPLTGEDDEWVEVRVGVFQNKRCFRIFKENDEVYDLEGLIFRDKDGFTYTSRNSRVAVTFPYTPRSEIVEDFMDKGGPVLNNLLEGQERMLPPVVNEKEG